MQRSRGGAGRRWGRPGGRQSSRLVAYQGNASAPSTRPAYQSPASQPAGQRGPLTCFLSSRARKTGICISQKAFTSLFSFFGAAGRGHNIQSLCPPQKSSKSPKPPRPTPRVVNRSVEPKNYSQSGIGVPLAGSRRAQQGGELVRGDLPGRDARPSGLRAGRVCRGAPGLAGPLSGACKAVSA